MKGGLVHRSFVVVVPRPTPVGGLIQQTAGFQSQQFKQVGLDQKPFSKPPSQSRRTFLSVIPEIFPTSRFIEYAANPIVDVMPVIPLRLSGKVRSEARGISFQGRKNSDVYSCGSGRGQFYAKNPGFGPLFLASFERCHDKDRSHRFESNSIPRKKVGLKPTKEYL